MTPSFALFLIVLFAVVAFAFGQTVLGWVAVTVAVGFALLWLLVGLMVIAALVWLIHKLMHG